MPLLTVFDVFESGRGPDLAEVYGRPVRVESLADRPDAVVGIQCECHDVVIESAVDIALLPSHLERVGLAQRVGDVFLHPRVLGPVTECGLGQIVGSTNGWSEALADGMRSCALEFASDQLRSYGGIGDPLEIYIDAHGLPVTSNGLACLNLGGCPTNGGYQGDRELVTLSVTGIFQELFCHFRVIFVYPARVCLGLAHPVPQVQGLAVTG